MDFDSNEWKSLNDAFLRLNKQVNESFSSISRLSEFAKINIQDAMKSVNMISNVSIPKLSLPIYEIQRSLDSISKMKYELPHISIINFSQNFNLQTGAYANLGKTLQDTIKSMNVSLQNISIPKVDWSLLKNALESLDFEELEREEKGKLKDVVDEVLVEYDLVNPNKNIEETLDELSLAMRSMQKSQSAFNTIKFGIIVWLITYIMSMLINPFAQPLMDEYSSFIQHNGKVIIKEIQNNIKQHTENTYKLKNYKIVSTEKLVIRQTDKTNSSAVGELNFGQFVEVIEKNRNWTKISFFDYKNRKIEGWVYSRYLKNAIN
jgi:hypothetical protein